MKLEVIQDWDRIFYKLPLLRGGFPAKMSGAGSEEEPIFFAIETSVEK